MTELKLRPPKNRCRVADPLVVQELAPVPLRIDEPPKFPNTAGKRGVEESHGRRGIKRKAAGLKASAI
jgi:hypothetical protein